MSRINTKSKYIHEATCLVHDTSGGVCDCNRRSNPHFDPVAAENRKNKHRLKRRARAAIRANENNPFLPRNWIG